MSEAEDAVQEAWLRLSRADTDAVDNLGGWLTTVVARICLDMLRSRRARREDYVGTLAARARRQPRRRAPIPSSEALLADSVGLALLVVLETLTPAERLAFVLHDMFGVPFEEIAPIVERSPGRDAPAREPRPAARARRTPEPDADLARQRRVVDAFLAASRGGDFEALMAVLDPDVVFRIDPAGTPAGARPPIVGAERSHARSWRAARRSRRSRVRRSSTAPPAWSSGPPARPLAVVGFTVAAGRIVAIDLVADPPSWTD